MKRRRTREQILADFNAWVLMGRLKDKRAALKKARTLERKKK